VECLSGLEISSMRHLEMELLRNHIYTLAEAPFLFHFVLHPSMALHCWRNFKIMEVQLLHFRDLYAKCIRSQALGIKSQGLEEQIGDFTKGILINGKYMKGYADWC